jgi:hypothetical protein
MKNHITWLLASKYLRAIALFALAILLPSLVSCGGSKITGSEPEIASISSFNKDKLMLLVGNQKSLSLHFEPATAPRNNLSWSSSNPDVVSVSSKSTITGVIPGAAINMITAVAPGTAVITATAPNGKTASCAVTVRDVYVVGTVGSRFNSFGLIARLWVNGEAQDLCNLRETHTPNIFSGSYVGATSVKVFNNDVYVAGFDSNLQNINVAKLWINGEDYALGDGVRSSIAFSVYILDNGDAYVAGYIQGNPRPGYNATIWKVDGQTREIQTIDLGVKGVLWDIVISDGCAYLSGTIHPGVHNPDSNDATLWMFDLKTHAVQAHYLPGGCVAYRLAVSGTGDVYMAGLDNTLRIAKFWKMDGQTKAIQSIYLDTPSSSLAWGVAVSGNGNVYVAGRLGDRARVWKIDDRTLEVSVLTDLPKGRDASV